jgi:hydroxymethylglutaryl-CoA reductase
VIAASCNANKIILEHSINGCGFTATPPARPITLGQLFVQNVDPMNILEQKPRIISIANEYCPSMVSRGGGVIGMRIKQLQGTSSVIVEFQIDVCEAMGANCVNTVLAGLAERLASEQGWEIPYKIVSNAGEGRVTTASFSLSLSNWTSKQIPGVEIAKRIIQLNEWAKVDPSRAITHNKGIFNGIEAVGLATGQDLRAIHAAGHLHACKAGGTYQPLTEYRLTEGQGGPILHGSIEIALPVATVGGCLVPCSVARANLEFMRIGNVGELACVMAALGLGQNFAALRAIACEGIQEGHMYLHLQNVVNATQGVKDKERLLEELRKRKIHTQQGAQRIVEELEKSVFDDK